MAAAPPDRIEAIDKALATCRQGDFVLDEDLFFVHFADLMQPLTAESQETAAIQPADTAPESTDLGAVFGSATGLVVLTQTCDIVRSCSERPYVEVSPLIAVAPAFIEDVRRLRRPAFAYVPGAAVHHLVADLDRTMTIEKAVLAGWRNRITMGCASDDETRAFALTLARKRARFAFPNDFIDAARSLQEQMRKKHGKNHAEGAHLSALREIRVHAAPSWNAPVVTLTFWFIREMDPDGFEPAWSDCIDQWIKLFDQSGRFYIELAIPCRLADM